MIRKLNSIIGEILKKDGIRMASNLSYVIASKSYSVCVLLLVSLLFSRDQLGRFSLISSISFIFSIILGFGFPTAVAKFSGSHASADGGIGRDVDGAFMLHCLVMAVLASLGLSILAVMGADYTCEAFFGLTLGLTMALQNFSVAHAQAKQSSWMGFLLFLSYVVEGGALITLCHAGVIGSLNGILGMVVASSVIRVLCQYRALGIGLDILHKGGSYVALLKYGWPIFAHGGAGWMMAHGDRMILLALCPLGEMGEYALALQITFFITTIVSVLQGTYAARAFQEIRALGAGGGQDRRMQEIERLGHMSLVVLSCYLLVVIPIVLFLVFPLIFHEKYEISKRLIPLLILPATLNCIYYKYNLVLTAMDRNVQLLIASLAAGAIGLVAVAIFVGAMGIMGVVCSLLCGYGALYVGVRVAASKACAQRSITLNSAWNDLIPILLACLASAGLTVVLGP